MGLPELKFFSNKNEFSFYLSLFRVFLGIHVIKKVYFLWGSQSILFSNNVLFENKSSLLDILGISRMYIFSNSHFLLQIILITSIFYILGVGRNLTTVILFLEYKVLQDLVYPILNGGDNLLIFVLMYMIFTKSFDYFCLDSRRDEKSSKISNLVSNLAVCSICVHLGYVYFNSALHKIHSDLWFNGTALYYILHLERFRSPISHFIYNNGVFTTLGTYFTLVFELLFLFLIWNKYLRFYFIVAGVILHVGIYFTMMIYDFQIFFLSLYGFFLGDEFLKEKFYRFKNYVLSVW